MLIKKNLVIFLHPTCFSPPISTWIEYIKQNLFATFSGLTINLVKKCLLKSEHTMKVHMLQTFNNKSSTKASEIPTIIPSEDPSENDKENPSKTPRSDQKYIRDLIQSN